MQAMQEDGADTEQDKHENKETKDETKMVIGIESDKTKKEGSVDNNDTKMKEAVPEEDDEEKKKKEEELKKKYANWPLRNIKEPHENDVMYGRGGGTNHHPGNKRYRKLVEDRKLEYVNSKRLDKPLVALEIIRLWRAQLPPGRFLKLDEKSGLWNDVGDKKAREKTSQALREKAPLIRKQQEEEQGSKDGEEEDEPSERPEPKTTRFAEGTKEEPSGQVKKAVLARDHSLGREYLHAGEAVSLEGFSWQDPFKADREKRENSFERKAGSAASYPAGRNSSHGSLGMAPPHHTSIGGPPPPPDYWGRVTSSERQREFSNGRYESWGTPPFPYPPPPPANINASMHQRSGSWTHPPTLPDTHAPVHQRSGSWGSLREHSLSSFPLIGASVSRPADRAAFDSGRSSSSGYWGETSSSPTRGSLPPPPPPPGPYGGAARSGSLGTYRQPVSPSASANSTPSPKYSVDLNIAKTWSGGEVARTWSGDYLEPVQQSRSYESYDPISRGSRGNDDSSPIRLRGSYLPRPQMVKRDTSNQNETVETKPSVKRAALNRDNSLASNRLKQEYMPEYYQRKFDSEREVRMLSDNLEQSSLNPDSLGTQPVKPKPLANGERVSTIDAISRDLLVRPVPLSEGNRLSTIDALDLDLDVDPLITPDDSDPIDVKKGIPKPESLVTQNRMTTNEFFMDLVGSPIAENEEVEEKPNKRDLPKPDPLTAESRLTTKDFMDLVSAPIGEDGEVEFEPVGCGSPSLNQERISDEWLTQV